MLIQDAQLYLLKTNSEKEEDWGVKTRERLVEQEDDDKKMKRNKREGRREAGGGKEENKKYNKKSKMKGRRGG